LWKNADDKIPVITDARAEYGRPLDLEPSQRR
jgi:hypothetical protein